MKDEINDEEHLRILNNKEADFISKISTFKEYLEIGFDFEKAKKMSGLQSYDFSKNKELQSFINKLKIEK